MGMGVGGPRRSAQMQSLSDDIQLNKAEKAWKSSTKKTRVEVESESDDSEHGKTQELFKSVRSILNKLTPQKFQQLMKMVTNLTIDTEERLKGVIELTFEKAIAEPNFSVVYANMCRCLMGLKVETTDKPGVTVNFRKLLLNRCQKEYEKDQVDDKIFERKQKELEAATVPEEKQRLTEQLQREKDNARRRSMGNMKFIGELFKLKMLTEVIMHDCIVKLLKNHDEEFLECLCRLLSTIGKDLDFEKAKPRMDQYFNQMENIIKDKKTSSRIRFMLQDVLDLRRSSWVPRRGEQGPKTIEQIHKDTELEEQREQMKVQHAFISKPSGGHGGRNDGGRNDGGRNDGGGRGGRWGREGRDNQGRGQPPQDEGWNTVPISKNRPIDTSRLSKITKSHKKAGAMWQEGGLRWRDFLAEDVDVNKFVTEKKVEFTLGVESEDGQKEELSSEELSKQIQRLIQDQADDQRLFDWIEANLDEQQISSNMLVRALMTCICQSAIIYENPNKLDAAKIKKRAKVLQKYLSDDKKELQALYALQALMVELEQPANLLRMFFDSLYDEDVIKEEAFYKWESSKDPAEQQGKGVALKSVTAFLTWLREAEDEDESDNS
ncbi:Eukaryotic translation initiation factor 4 gamma 1 [Dissostichus eleginoides]|uniref:Eukaryotic translation initiation factor 4 gamma 1 n=1 Tax=Dissostichus eleginoides TaxID=100907 RepID=A0AAD9CFW7_DISEL|nr:Eukaryotic translation initiation factor 4 gamma 1 [Dissostichus eleginoides]